MGEMRQTLLSIVTDLGHIRVEVAKTQGKSDTIEGKGLVVWALVVVFVGLIGPVVMNRIFPPPAPQIIVQPAVPLKGVR